MNENNELILHIYETVSMGAESTTNLLKALKNRDNKIKGLVEEELKEYEMYLKESEKILKKNKINIKKPNLMARIGSNMGIMMETMKDNSDSAIASMLMEGFVMGISEMNSKIKAKATTISNCLLKLFFEKFIVGDTHIHRLLQSLTWIISFSLFLLNHLLLDHFQNNLIPIRYLIFLLLKNFFLYF